MNDNESAGYRSGSEIVDLMDARYVRKPTPSHWNLKLSVLIPFDTEEEAMAAMHTGSLATRCTDAVRGVLGDVTPSTYYQVSEFVPA